MTPLFPFSLCSQILALLGSEDRGEETARLTQGQAQSPTARKTAKRSLGETSPGGSRPPRPKRVNSYSELNFSSIVRVDSLGTMALPAFGEGGSAGGSLTDVPVDGFLSLTNGLTLIGFISAVTWGLGYFGQPHIIVRFMAIDTVEKVRPARNIGMTWMGVALLGSIGIGIAGRAFTERNGIVVDDPETIFIVLANLLFHPLITGFLLAALLAAIMSTISSQLLVASSSLTEDFYKLFFRRHASERESVNVGRICVALVAIAAIVIASNPDSQVLGLVSNAWAGFGAAFGPLIILSAAATFLVSLLVAPERGVLSGWLRHRRLAAAARRAAAEAASGATSPAPSSTAPISTGPSSTAPISTVAPHTGPGRT